ncbi:MAG: hypothetical protein JL50_11380 [Peptococcaceae bacterium BICA1-7]|nr:MAG: hypothetical protein JL50_11380 [Peptococcaceae bacterium BICA1-7]
MAHSQKRLYFLKARDLKDAPLWEYHVHTSYTDGQCTVGEVVSFAQEQGITRLVFTEHTEPEHANTKGWFGQYLGDIERERRLVGNRIDILAGLEVPVTDLSGGLHITREMERQAQFILGAVHRYPGIGARRVGDLSREEALELEYRCLMSLAQNPRVDSIAHIGGTFSQYWGTFPHELSAEVIAVAARNGVAIEINSQYHRPMETYIRMCLDCDAYITLGSNAHRLREVGLCASLLRDGSQVLYKE